MRRFVHWSAELIRHAVEAPLGLLLADGSCVCNVCGRKVREFQPIPRWHLDKLRRSGWPYPLDRFETLNLARYFCPVCRSSDRDRLLALHLQEVFRVQRSRVLRLLDIAPSRPLAKFIWRSAKGIDLRYRSADLSGFGVDDRVDITNLACYADASWDVTICSHVLEHIPEDRKALRELFRVTAPGGQVLLLVPLVTGVEMIDEDATITDPFERWRRFGQDDHVRLYSKAGFVERIAEAGFRVRELGASQFAPEQLARFGISNTSVLYLGERPLEPNAERPC